MLRMRKISWTNYGRVIVSDCSKHASGSIRVVYCLLSRSKCFAVTARLGIFGNACEAEGSGNK